MKKLTLILIIGGLALLLFLATPVRADHGDSNPPEIGDWHIRNDTFVSNTSILMNGNISLEKDVSLTFLNVSLTFNSTDSLRYYIETLGDDSWSNLSILDSRLQGLSQSETFYIWFKSHGKIRLENSGFRYCFGISIQDARVIVLGSVFTEMTMTALSLSATAADSIIKDNTFHNLRYGVALGEFHADSSVLIQNNNFYLGVRGLWISSMSRTGPKIVIEKNNFSRFSLKAISISQFQNSYLVQNNYICDSYVGVSFSVEGRNGYDTSHSARFSNMSFDNCHTVYESGDPGGFVARTAMVVNNSFVNCTGVHASLNMTRLLTQDSPFEMDKMIINDELSSATVNWSKTLRVMSQDGFPLEDTRVWLQGEENQSTCVLTDQEGLYSFQLTGFWINQTQKRDLRNYDFCLEKGYVNTSIHFTLHNNTPLEVVLEMDRHNVPSQHFLLRTESSVLEALPKESLELLVELVNAGWENDSYFIKAQDSPWLDIDLEDPFPFLGSNRTTTIRLQVWLSDRALAGQEFPLELLVHSAGNRSLVKAVNFTVRVGAAPGFWLEANLPDQIDPVNGSLVELTVSNIGNLPDNFTLENILAPDGWIVEPVNQSLLLPAFSSGIFELQLTPPAWVSAGNYSLELVVRDLEGSNHSLEIPLVLGTRYGLEITGTQQSQGLPGESVLFRLMLNNTGNLETRINISSSGLLPHLKSFLLPRNESQTLELELLLPKNALAGELVKATVHLTLDNGEEQMLELVVRVLEQQGLSLELPATPTLEQGVSTRLRIVVHNTGNTQLELNISMLPVENVSVELEERSLVIPSSGQASLELVLTLNSHSLEQVGKERKLCLLLEGGELREEKELWFTLGEYHALSLSFEEGPLVEENTLSILVKNQGSVEELISLKTTAPPGWRLMSPGQQFRVLAAETLSIPVKVERISEEPTSGNLIFYLDLNGQTRELSIPTPPLARVILPQAPIMSGDAVQIRANSSGEEGELNHSWLLEGNSYLGETFHYSFSKPGRHALVYTLRDSNNLSDSLHLELEVGNQAPQAHFRMSREGAMVVLDASLSTDPDGNITRYFWEVNGRQLEGTLMTHVFPEPGEYDIGLVVVDALGAQNTTSQTIILPEEAFEGTAEESTFENSWVLALIVLVPAALTLAIGWKAGARRRKST